MTEYGSGPVALCTSNAVKSFATPSQFIAIGDMSETLVYNVFAELKCVALPEILILNLKLVKHAVCKVKSTILSIAL